MIRHIGGNCHTRGNHDDDCLVYGNGKEWEFKQSIEVGRIGPW